MTGRWLERFGTEVKKQEEAMQSAAIYVSLNTSTRNKLLPKFNGLMVGTLNQVHIVITDLAGHG